MWIPPHVWSFWTSFCFPLSSCTWSWGECWVFQPLQWHTHLPARMAVSICNPSKVEEPTSHSGATSMKVFCEKPVDSSLLLWKTPGTKTWVNIFILISSWARKRCIPASPVSIFQGMHPDIPSQVDSEDPHQRRQRKARYCFGGVHTDSQELGRAYPLEEPCHGSDGHSLNCLDPSEPRGLEPPHLGHVGGTFESPPMHWLCAQVQFCVCARTTETLHEEGLIVVTGCGQNLS